MRGRFAALLLLSASLLGAQTREQFDSMPDWVRFLLAVPGVPQIYLGQPEGYAYAVIGIPTLVAGTGLYAWYLAGDRADAEIPPENSPMPSANACASPKVASMPETVPTLAVPSSAPEFLSR